MAQPGVNYISQLRCGATFTLASQRVLPSYGHGAYGGHRFYYGTHGWAGYSRGYRWGHHRFWRGGVWVWGWGYDYDAYFDGPLYYFDDGYVPDDVAPQPDYAPADGAYYDNSSGGDAASDDQGCTYDPNDPNPQPCYDESQARGIQQPQAPQQLVAPPQPTIDDDTYYQEGASAPGNTAPQR